MKTIFDGTVLGAIPLKNRIWRSATWLALSQDGRVNDTIIRTYEVLAKGQAAAIITGLVSISPMDESLLGGVCFRDDSDLDGHRRLTEAVHRYGARIYLQAAMVDGDVNGWSREQIRTVVGHFGDAAERAEKAGYDGVQIHAAHFFFLSKFLSPAVNKRKDSYGGTPEDRARILVEILRDMRAKTRPEFSIIIKINASDFLPGGLEDRDFFTACKMLAVNGIDAIEVSANGTSVSGVKAGVNEAYFSDYADALKAEVDIPVILVGGHRSIEAMNRLLNETDIEYLSMSRPLIREPDLMQRWMDGDIRPALCISCNSCYRTDGHTCIFNSKKK